MANPGRKSNISKGKDPPKPGRVRSKTYRAKMREIKMLDCFFRLEALVMHWMARHALAGDVYHTAFGVRLEPRTDADREATRAIWEEVLRDTEWAMTDGEPPDGWIPPKWVRRSK